jgi:hypothetical protein
VTAGKLGTFFLSKIMFKKSDTAEIADRSP